MVSLSWILAQKKRWYAGAGYERERKKEEISAIRSVYVIENKVIFRYDIQI